MKDLVGRGRSERWGTRRYEKSLKDVLQGKYGRAEGARLAGQYLDPVRREAAIRAGTTRQAKAAREKGAWGMGKDSGGGGKRDVSTLPPAVPVGKPISGALRVPEKDWAEPMRAALATIDSVHGDGELPLLPVSTSRAKRETGAYHYTQSGQALGFTASREADALSMTHEIGHFLDHQGLGAAGQFASETGDLRIVMSAIARSEAISRLKARTGKSYAVVEVAGKRRRVSADQRLVRYYLEPKECFARAYSQYIALRSQNPALLDLVEGRRRAVSPGLVYHAQWEEGDFRPIAEAIDHALRRRGWIQLAAENEG